MKPAISLLSLALTLAASATWAEIRTWGDENPEAAHVSPETVSKGAEQTPVASPANISENPSALVSPEVPPPNPLEIFNAHAMKENDAGNLLVFISTLTWNKSVG